MKNLLLAAILGVFCLGSDLRANYVLSGSDNGLSASANFVISGDTLTITVTNTSTTAVTSASKVLTGFYFTTTTPAMGFTSESAAFPAGTVKIVGATDSTLSASTNAGTYWGFDNGLAGTPDKMQYGFMSTALTSTCTGAACGTTLTGNKDLTDTSVNGGLVPKKSDIPSTTVYDDSIVFTLTMPANCTFTTADVASATFQFGDAGLTETDFVVLPEPVSYSAAIALLLLPVIWYKRRRHQKSVTGA